MSGGQNDPKDQESRTWAQWLREKASMEVKAQEPVEDAEKAAEDIRDAGGRVPSRVLTPTKKRKKQQ